MNVRDAARFERELRANPPLADLILELPEQFPTPLEPEQVTIRTDAASADLAIARALALGLAGCNVNVTLEAE